MKHNNLRAGFTLVELMVFFLFISILIAASTPLITKRIKSVPSRTYHGKFLCYRDDMGQLHGDYYNAAGKKVKEAPVVSADSIIFEPPKRAAVFKVEMVGAGAGGYNYTNYENEIDARHKFTFNENGDGDYSGDTVYKLSDNDIKNSLQGLTNTISAYTGKGGDAGSIAYRYSVPSLMITQRAIASVEKDSKTHFLYFDVENYNPSTMSKEWKEEGLNKENTQANIKGPYKDFQQYAASEYPDKKHDPELKDASKKEYTRQLEYTATTEVQSTLRGIAIEKGLADIYRIPVSPTRTVEGGKGGKGSYISYTYKIDFNSAEAKGKTPQEYIKWLMDTYKSGMSTRPANEMNYLNFQSGITVSDGSNGSNTTASISSAVNGFASGSSQEGTVAIAGDGGNANGYAALQIGYHKYLTNKQKATGGNKTQMSVDKKGPIMLVYRNGLDADSLGMIDSDGTTYPASGSGSSSAIKSSAEDTSSRKYIELISTVPIRTYYIGASGESGTYISKQVANLGTRCTITLPPANQSSAISFDTDVDNLEIVPTKFTCEGWNNPIEARSGSPTKKCRTENGTENGGSDYCNSSSAIFPTYNPYATLSESDRFTGTGFVEPPPKEIYAQIAEISQFGLFGSVFTKTPSLAEYGRGGKGAGYIDLCMKMGGQININTMDSSNSTPVRSRDPIYFPYDASCSMSNNPRTAATAGGKGAIIISW